MTLKLSSEFEEILVINAADEKEEEGEDEGTSEGIPKKLKGWRKIDLEIVSKVKKHVAEKLWILSLRFKSNAGNDKGDVNKEIGRFLMKHRWLSLTAKKTGTCWIHKADANTDHLTNVIYLGLLGICQNYTAVLRLFIFEGNFLDGVIISGVDSISSSHFKK